ncbi:MAG: T9SS type A sorting domain-containing protein [Candidatus Eisenbacteria bacterium]|uniref:T9SS type A sorting domain-containing protein n=1 Tax=Eiseniibacteriota bacterium TaxID=2212470 RepID=A0A933SCH0_UNCEI|nr:T9SS type A sorting domain-containing protein [Candidatus Eisenbacteria bacterium]
MMSRLHFVRAAVAALALVLIPALAGADWPRDPGTGGLAVCTSTNFQWDPFVVPDGFGGVLMAWTDVRSGTSDIYAQRINAQGVAQWTANGVVVCSASGNQSLPELVPDGTGGAIVVWEDVRSGNSDVYAQRINSSGTPQWTANGVAICTAANSQSSVSVASDGAGGAIIGWQDYRALNNDIYTQRISSAGVAQWGANGLAVCTTTDSQTELVMCSDGAAGAYYAWTDARNYGTNNNDIYGQHVLANGTANWGANGAAICSATLAQAAPQLVPNQNVGVTVIWVDYRNGNADIYAEIMNSGGSWLTSARELCTATGDQTTPLATSDGSGGAIVYWRDFRTDINGDLYAARFTAAGGIPWTANGVSICTTTGSQYTKAILPDGGGGAALMWSDYRDGAADVYAQRVNSSGVNHWTSGGIAVSTAIDHQVGTSMAGLGDEAFVVTWYDHRSSTWSDIYAQRVDKYGKLGDAAPTITKVKDVPNDQGGAVKVSWNASYLDADPTYGVLEYRLFRSVPGSIAGLAARRATTTDSDVAAGTGALLVTPNAAVATAWEYVGTQAAEALDSYSRVVSTTSDSIGGSNPRTYFMIEARSSTSISASRWFSQPDSGYSVDNLGPATPAPLTGQYAAGTTRLHWNPNAEGDLAGYRVYRGSSVAFAPSPANLVIAQPDTGAADAAGAPYVYKVTAVDVHGNESPVATLIPSGTLGTEGAPATLEFSAPRPNPARGKTTLRFSLTTRGPVKLALYDAAGRRVTTITEGVMEAGAHSATLQLHDASGRELPAGLYLARFEAEGRTITRRIVAVR